MFEIVGEHAKARVMTDRERVEDDTISQIYEMLNHGAIQNDVVIQPDTHPGAGSVIGFTMPLGERITPNIVGVDIGCGVNAFKVGEELPLNHEVRESKIRDTIPMGRNVNDFDDSPHLYENFPWAEANKLFQEFNEAYKDSFGMEVEPLEFDFQKYGPEYFDELCDRVLSGKKVSQDYIIKGAGTLGGGNHFIEFGQSQRDDSYWCVIHSGSRYIGKATAEYWQNKAEKRRKSEDARDALQELNQYHDYVKFNVDEVSDEDLLDWVQGGKGEDFVDFEALKSDYAPENSTRIQEISTELKQAVSGKRGHTELDWLEGQEAHGYFVDLIFCQIYARWNRRLMGDKICEALDVSKSDTIESTHNFIDFRDMIVRKGATPAREGKELVIPFNMADGTLIARGKGNEDFLYTAPHGAGRVMSRREAKDIINMDEFKDAMDGIYSESVKEETIDEAPQAYKNAEVIAEKVGKTAEILDRLEVVHNLKGYE